MSFKSDQSFNRLLEIMHRLRQECPWDQKQTHSSLIRYCIEECYELVDAIHASDFENMKEELGDLLLQVIFHAELAQEKKRFNMEEVIEHLSQKLIRRHPHVFSASDSSQLTEAEVRAQWDQIKEKEKSNQPPTRSFFKTARSLPSLARSLYLSRQAAKLGFDWECPSDAWNKVNEEFEELANAATPEQREEEMGDLLFAVSNFSRLQGIDPDRALERANLKFQKRFDSMLDSAPNDFETLSQSEKETLWQKAKARLTKV